MTPDSLLLYTKDHCPYCVKAKQYLSKLGINYDEINITNSDYLRLWLKDQGHKTVPQIYQGSNVFIEGGANELLRLSKEEILERMEQINVS